MKDSVGRRVVSKHQGWISGVQGQSHFRMGGGHWKGMFCQLVKCANVPHDCRKAKTLWEGCAACGPGVPSRIHLQERSVSVAIPTGPCAYYIYVVSWSVSR